MPDQPAVAGQRFAEQQTYVGWLVLGTLFGPVGPFFAHVLTPVVPTSVIEAGPAQPVEQQLFLNAYTGRAKNLRIRQAWFGFVLSFFFYAAACVGGCMTFFDATFDYMLQNRPSQGSSLAVEPVDARPLVLYRPAPYGLVAPGAEGARLA